MHVLILGAGGLGCVIGGCLAETGVDVTLVARQRHVVAIERDGLVISGLRGDRLVRSHLRAVPDPREVDADVDYLILATKTRSTSAALATADPIKRRIASVLSVQNSLDKDERLAEWIGREKVIGAATTEAATLTGDGRVAHVGTAPTSCYFGELDGRPSERVDSLVKAFNVAGIGAASADDIRQVQWEKQLQIAIVSGFSATAVGFHPTATFAHGIAVRPGAELYVTIATELLAVYRALGFSPRDFFAPYSRFRLLAEASWEEAVDDMLEHGRTMIATGVLGRPSLHEDLRHGRPTEVDEALGVFVREAKRLGIPAPAARVALQVIRTSEELAHSCGAIEEEVAS